MRSVRLLALARIAVAVTLLVGLAAPLCAQGIPTARLTGRVTSEGEPLPGVTVTVTSPNLQGERSSITSENGDYLFPSLPPGEYDVRFELSGLEPVHNRIRLGAAQSAVLDSEMKLQTTLSEAIVVTGSLEQISQGSEAATTYTHELVEELPVGRTINDIVAVAPGLHTSGPLKAATAAGSGNSQAQISVGGAVTFENLYLVNGVVVN